MAELGLLVPVFLLVLVGVLDFSRVLMVQHVVTNAAREGARFGAWGDADSGAVRDHVESYLQGAGLDEAQTKITVSGTRASSGQPTAVTVEYPLNSFVLKMLQQNSQIALSSTSSMPHE